MVSTLARYTGRMMTEHTPDSWHWRGRPVRLVDGATVTLPDTEENQTVYPQPRSQQPGLGFPLCRVVGIVCLASGAALDAALGPCRGKGSDEQSLPGTMPGTLDAGDLLLGDALFMPPVFCCVLFRPKEWMAFSSNMIHGSAARIFARESVWAREIDLIEIDKPKVKPAWMSQAEYDQTPDRLKVRELRAGGKILVTTLLCSKSTSKAALKALYRNRWQVELDIRNIKTTPG